MTKVKFDVSGSDATKARGRDFEQPKPGIYKAKLVECSVTEPEGKDRRVEAVYEIFGATGEKKKYNGARLWEYINLVSEAAVWKLDQWLQAHGLATEKKRKGTIDTDAMLGDIIKVRVKAGSNKEGEYRGEIGSLMELGDDDDDEGDDSSDDEPDEDQDDSEEDEEGEEGPLDESDDEGDDSSEGGDSSDEDYSEMSVEELRTELDDRGLSTKGSRNVLVKRLEKSDEE